ncbi:uncharacterized protein LOC117169146 isoform X5 [Belonocnema kinseyi]|uniref:uncharacterized protein LOC117169146 isoform X5 n=1 Tax=Belonocnema kinseyi TaxID=2817044 RepID=UPI00143CEDCD|nr:uncharacterized protein LOC117169146 isoform X5 [Belonocnema kinseyi]
MGTCPTILHRQGIFLSCADTASRLITKMEYAHRLRLDMTIHHFVDHVDMLALWPYLFINKIYATTDHNVSNWAKNLTDPEIIKDIILTIKTRGSLAYHNLILSLQQTNQHFLADLLGIDTIMKVGI